MKCQSLCSGNSKSNINMSSAEFAQRVVNVKTTIADKTFIS